MALARALHGRLQGTKFPAGVSVKVPEIHRLTWKPSRMADKTTVYAFAWCEGCTLDVLRADIGLCYYLLPFSLILLTPRIRCPKISAPKIVHNDNFHEGVMYKSIKHAIRGDMLFRGIFKHMIMMGYFGHFLPYYYKPNKPLNFI